MHVVCAWIGNSEPVTAKHHLQVTDDHFEQAAKEAVQQGHVGSGKTPQTVSVFMESCGSLPPPK
jgi:hypothetical protein